MLTLNCWSVCAQAQTLYVGNQTSNFVGAYDANSGAATNAALITGLSGPNGGPYGLATAGNSLYVTLSGGTTVGRYDATSGAAINAAFVSGLRNTAGLAVAGILVIEAPAAVFLRRVPAVPADVVAGIDPGRRTAFSVSDVAGKVQVAIAPPPTQDLRTRRRARRCQRLASRQLLRANRHRPDDQGRWKEGTGVTRLTSGFRKTQRKVSARRQHDIDVRRETYHLGANWLLRKFSVGGAVTAELGESARRGGHRTAKIAATRSASSFSSSKTKQHAQPVRATS